MSTEGQTESPPWITLWFSPRQTIERLIAGPPASSVWWLAALGTIAALYQQIMLVCVAGLFGDWQFALGVMLVGAVGGIVWLYLYAIILSWIGRWFGGRASAAEIRVVFGWSMVPTIVGGVAVLLIGAAVERSAWASAAAAVPVLVFSLWSQVIFLLMFGRVERFGVWRTIFTYLVAAFLFAFAVSLLVRSFVYQSFNAPSSSMRPTLLVGDYFFVSKFAYGYSRFSLPFAPPLPSGRILSSRPQAGDVVVFRHPKDAATDYVKRVVGLPGDRMQMKQGQLYINDAPVKRERLTNVAEEGACGTSGGLVKRWRETLPNGVSFETLDCFDGSPLDNTNVFTVPDSDFFVLGDNRDNSTDSRMASFGTVPFENLIGRVSLIYFSFDAGEGGTAAHVRAERTGIVVR
jgi:signal peptidase I